MYYSYSDKPLLLISVDDIKSRGLSLDLTLCTGIIDVSALHEYRPPSLMPLWTGINDIPVLVSPDMSSRDRQISYSQLQLNRNFEKMYKNSLYSYDPIIIDLHKKYLKKKRQLQKKYNREQYQHKLKHHQPRVQKQIGCQHPRRYKKRQ